MSRLLLTGENELEAAYQPLFNERRNKMPKIYKNGIEYAGSSNKADEILMSDGTTVEGAIQSVESAIGDAETEITSLKTDLGNKSSASAVSGDDAFAKINTLNSNISLKGDCVTLYNKKANTNVETDIDFNGYKQVTFALCWYGGVINAYTVPIEKAKRNTSRLSGFVDTTSNIVEAQVITNNTTVKTVMVLNPNSLSDDGLTVEIYGIK